MRKPSRRLWTGFGLIGVAALAAGFTTPIMSFADSPSGCDFAANGTTPSCSAPLAPSSFEAGDGNLVPNQAGNTDWSTVANLNTGIDLPSGTGDNAFGQGTKEDNANVTVVSGSIPPNKSDLTRFYEASELAGGDNYLYLGWERTNVLGSANMDFEINQNATANFSGSTTGPVTINRTAGDLLVTFDFTNGGGTPTLGLLRWVTTGPTSQCFSSSTLPCWGNHVSLNGTDSIGAVNNIDAVTDPIAPNAPRSLPALTFGEAAINLTTAGVFPPGTCEAFGSTFLKSRSSASFTAEVKDFVAPVPVNISNCGTITVHKVTQNAPAGDHTSFGYTSTGGLTPATFNLAGGGQQQYQGVPAGSYSVNESSPLPTGWNFVSLACTSTGAGTGESNNGETANITMAGGGNVDCTYTNHFTNSPTIATSLSASTANIGDPVHDSATLSGASATPTGTVTYAVYTDRACTTPATAGSGGQISAQPGQVTLASGSVPNSPDISFNVAGTYYWQAVYSGDANNNGATSPCASEPVLIKTNPTVTTTLSATTVNIGDPVHDSATLNGTTADATGTVTYTVYTDNACTVKATSQISAQPGQVTVTNGTAMDSTAISFNDAGTYYWQAVYSGDSKNNGATSACTSETVLVNPNHPTIGTAQNLLPNDNATLSGATPGAGTSITFELFGPADPTCASTPAYTQTVPVSGDGTYKTTNTTLFATSVGEWRWMVTYTGDNNNTGTTSACGVENFTITNVNGT